MLVESPLDGQDLIVASFLFGHGNRGSRNARSGKAPRARSIATKAAALALVAARGPRRRRAPLLGMFPLRIWHKIHEREQRGSRGQGLERSERPGMG